MKLPRHLDRTFASLACGLLLWLCGSAAQAQAPLEAPPPVRPAVDARGVDLLSGKFNLSTVDVSIGEPGAGGLAYIRTLIGNGWRDNMTGTIALNSSIYTVSIGAYSEQFTRSGSTYTPVENNGSTLTQSGSTYTYTTSDGMVALFSTGYSSWSGQASAIARATSITAPNGEVTTFHFKTVSVPKYYPDVPPFITIHRLQSVTNNLGYQLHFRYLYDEPQEHSDINNFFVLLEVAAFNRTLYACPPLADVCGSSTWPSVTYAGGAVTRSGRTTTYSFGPYGVTGIRRPTSSIDDIVLTYDGSGRVATWADNGDVWSYDFTIDGSTMTTTITDPLNNDTVVEGNPSRRIVTSVTDPLGNITAYTYDSENRLIGATRPEGDATTYTYDSRGNVLTTTLSPKPGPALDDIETSATYPSTCTNRVTCNRPLTTTDALAGVTEYEWDDDHGGLLSVTLPAPSPGAIRPETRYAYDDLHAWYKNDSGVIAQAATPVARLVETSQCATTASCDGGADEVLTQVGYGASGVANNLLPVSVSQGDGAGTLTATTTMTWTATGEVATVNGPLLGADDTTTYRYNATREMIGVIGPDPDAAGPLQYRALRYTYNLDGQQTKAEQGTVAGTTDPDWSNFTTLVQMHTTYDEWGRPVMVQGTAGATVYALQQTSYDELGRPECAVARMNPATFAAPPASACTAATVGGFGPDRIVRTTYDAASRVLTTTSAPGLPEAITEGVTWTDNGLPASLTDGNGNVSVLEYDRFDRLARLRYPNATGGGTSTTDYESSTYDTAGRVITGRDRAGAITTLTWDALGRVTSIDAPAGTMDVAATYDNLGRVLTTTGDSQTLTNVWDSLSRLTSETGPLGKMAYQYDAASRMTRITWPDAFYAAYDHDLYGAVTAIRENGAGSGVGVLATYGYGDLGQLTGIARAGGAGASTAYGYDAFARLTSLAHDAGGTADDVTLGFTYNPAGGIAGRTVSNAAYVQAPVPAATVYEVDGLNAVTGVAGGAVTYDANRNITGVAGSAWGYDAANRLTSADAGAGAATFAFDPADRLYQSSVGAASTRFQYAGAQLAAEYDATGALVRRHIPGLGLDDVVTSYEGPGTSNRSWLLADERGSVIALAGGTGAVTTIDRYDEYGVPASGNVGRFQYTGQMWLAEAGVYHYRARAYAPQIGRFMQTDPVGYAAGANLYGYVSADPVNFVDPLGLSRTAYTCVSRPVWPNGEVGEWAQVWVRECTDRLAGDPMSRRVSGFGYMPSFNPVQNDAAFAPYQAARLQAIHDNQWMVWVVLAPEAAVGLAEIGTALTGRAIVKACNNCFEADTPVRTDSGPRAIQDIEVGDLVLARDELTGETAFKPVVALIDGAERQIWEVVVETVDAEGAARRETIGATDDHPWRLIGGDWAETAELYPGAELVTASGDRAVVVSVLATDRIERTYNFEVEGFHTYFVGESGVWVHNANCLTPIGRALAKKFGRPGSKFGQVKGSPADINNAAQGIYDDIVQNGARSARHHARFGDIVEYRLPGVGGVRLGADGRFIGFLEP